MENETKYTINPQPGTEELIIRHGTAPENDKIEQVNISGDIRTPYEYWASLTTPTDEEMGAGNMVLFANYDIRQLILCINMGSGLHRRDIYGKLHLSTEAAPFGINTSKKFGPKELIELFKFNKHRFEERETALQLIKSLQKWNVSVTSLLQDTDDERGNTKYSFEQKVEGIEFLKNLRLNLPIFKNEAPVLIDVEIVATVQGRDVMLSLISPHLHELIEEQAKDRMDDEILLFSGSGLPVIYE